jgi:hypothetical protein
MEHHSQRSNGLSNSELDDRQWELGMSQERTLLVDGRDYYENKQVAASAARKRKIDYKQAASHLATLSSVWDLG